jgi:hypothetical protein
MRIVHVTTFVYPVPKTHTLPMPQSLDSYSGWDIEKNDACEIQYGTRYQIAYAASEHPTRIRPQISTDQLVSLFSRSLSLERWIARSVEVVVTIEVRNIQG